ncbi:histidine kinase [Pseudoalteromonas spongiae]|uniref:Histidine kinase n=1 Tax=Pseudoalteromonas spongiae TaxID=298657 RepID=A0ABU8EXU8_9GAMM
MPKAINYLVLFVFSLLIVLYAALLTTPNGQSLNIHLDAPFWIFLQCVIAQWLTLKVYRFVKQGNSSITAHITKVFFVSNLVFSTLVTSLVIALETAIGIQQVDSMHMVATLGMNALLHALVGAYSLAFELVTRLQRQQLVLAKKDKALLDSQVKTLQQHIDPHFLFNNLNVLSALIVKDPDEAEEYLAQFSDIYRYILEHKSKNLVPLSHELAFANHYMALINTRFNGAYTLNVTQGEGTNTSEIIPCALQLAIENVVKHNAASSDNPLEITIDIQSDCIVITNPLRLKEFKAHSSKIGLTHLNAQCQAIFNQSILVDERNGCFSLTLPLGV